MLTFYILYEGIPIKDTKDLVIAYLNNFGNELIIEVKKGISPMENMDEEIQESYEEMHNQFERLTTTSSVAVEPLSIQNGVLSKDDLIKVITFLIEKTKSSLFEAGKKFIAKRQEFYGINEDNYRKVVTEQMEYQEMLIIICTTQALTHFGLTNQIYEESVKLFSSDQEIKAAIESMAIEGIFGTGEIPHDLTQEKLREVLIYSYNFIEEYISKNSNLTPMDIMILKSRESDEVYKKFNYDEFQVSSAMTKYNIDTDPQFEEIRNKLSILTTQLFKANMAQVDN